MISGNPRIVVTVDGDDSPLHARAEVLAHQLGISLAPGDSISDDSLVLAVRADGLELRDHESKPGRGLRADFSWLANRRTARGSANLSKNQPLAKAIGTKTRTVLDATAGLGQDAALLAAMGWQVLAVERSPVLAALLEEGLRRACEDEGIARALEGRLRIVHADARDLLRMIDPKPDVVYIDPMFPPRRKSSALAKKSIRLVRQLVGDDPDAAELLRVAREVATDRVVVKRLDDSPELAAGVTMAYRGKTVRYDVYR